MEFDLTGIVLTNGATDADPIAAPGSVPEARIGRLPDFVGRTELNPGNSLMLTLESSSAETVTLDVYAMDDTTATLALADRLYYLVEADVILTHGVLTQVLGSTDPVPPGGYMYFRMTADTMSADGELKVAMLNR